MIDIRPWDTEWWRYILKSKAEKDILWIRVILCRIRNHPEGPIWYNPYGLEPNMRCKNCYDNLS